MYRNDKKPKKLVTGLCPILRKEYIHQIILSLIKQEMQQTKRVRCRRTNAGDGIRTREHLRDRALNPAPLTWLGNPRSRGHRARKQSKVLMP